MAKIYLSPPDVGDNEREMLMAAFDSNWIAPAGPDLDAFESEVAACVGVGHAAGLSSGTAALHLALEALGVSDGDDVLVSDLTFAATANAVTYVGATPVFIGSSPDSWTMDPGLLAEELELRARRGRLPAAVIVVDLYGQSADYGPILDACARFEVPVVEDAAEGLGATYRGRPCGSFGELAALSFNGNKIITTGGGGMLLSDRAELVERARHLATQAREPVPHYEHRTVGYNYRLSNLLAALGRGQLRGLDERVRRRRETNRVYRDAFADVDGVSFMPLADYGEPSCWLTVITVDEASFGVGAGALRLHLEAQDIESRPAWKPMHLQPVFRDCGVRGGDVDAEIFRTGLCLPSGSGLTDAQRTTVIEAVTKAPSAIGRTGVDR
jgi:dTDP-4-amino-4,6-dideoxygalactose transaminase